MKGLVTHLLACAVGGVLAWVGLLVLQERAVTRALAIERVDTGRPSSPPKEPEAPIQSDRDAPQGSRSAASSQARLEQRIAALEAAVVELTAAVRATRAPASKAPEGSPPAGVDVVELRESVAELQRTIVAELERVRDEDLSRLREEKPEPDWAELDQLVHRWRLDPAPVEQEVKLLTVAELLRRYGSPTEIWSNAKGTHWTYGQGYDPATERYRTEIYLRLQDGVVTSLSIDER